MFHSNYGYIVNDKKFKDENIVVFERYSDGEEVIVKLKDAYTYKLANEVPEKHIDFVLNDIDEYCQNCEQLKFYNAKQSKYYCPRCDI